MKSAGSQQMCSLDFICTLNGLYMLYIILCLLCILCMYFVFLFMCDLFIFCVSPSFFTLIVFQSPFLYPVFFVSLLKDWLVPGAIPRHQTSPQISVAFIQHQTLRSACLCLPSHVSSIQSVCSPVWWFTSYPVMAMRCMESLTALRMPKMEVSASCRSSAPSQLLLYFSISCSQTHNKHAVQWNE